MLEDILCLGNLDDFVHFLVLELEDLLVDVFLLLLGRVDVFLEGVVNAVSPREEVPMSVERIVFGLELISVGKDGLILAKSGL